MGLAEPCIVCNMESSNEHLPLLLSLSISLTHSRHRHNRVCRNSWLQNPRQLQPLFTDWEGTETEHSRQERKPGRRYKPAGRSHANPCKYFANNLIVQRFSVRVFPWAVRFFFSVKEKWVKRWQDYDLFFYLSSCSHCIVFVTSHSCVHHPWKSFLLFVTVLYTSCCLPIHTHDFINCLTLAFQCTSLHSHDLYCRFGVWSNAWIIITVKQIIMQHYHHFYINFKIILIIRPSGWSLMSKRNK